MKTGLLFILFALIAPGHSFAKGDTVFYYMDHELRRDNPRTGLYYRKAFKESDLWRVRDYYMRNDGLKMEGLYETKSGDTFTTKTGRFLNYHLNGTLSETATYDNGLLEGLKLRYDTSGNMIDSAYYKHGLPVARYCWDEKRNLICKGIYAEDGSGIGKEWEYFDNGNLAGYGKTAQGHKKDSIWTYYHKNGQVSSVETYSMGLITLISCFNENGVAQTANCWPVKMTYAAYSLAEFFSQNMRYPKKARQNNIEGKIYIEFTVDENGNITDIKDIGSYRGGGLNEEALRLISTMPKWKPAMQHGRIVKTTFMQPISFKLN